MRLVEAPCLGLYHVKGNNMKYVIEKDNKVIMGPSPWNQRLAKELGLKGNRDAPELGHTFEGKSLEPYRLIVAAPYMYELVGSSEMVKVDSVWTQVERTTNMDLDAAKKAHKQVMKIARKMYEGRGITYKGIQLRTDKQGQADWTAAAIVAQYQPATIRDWELEDGFVKLLADDFISIGALVDKHVQAGRTHLKNKWEEIDKAVNVSILRKITWDL